MSQEPRTRQGRAAAVYIRAAVFTLLADPADRAQAELVLRELDRRIRLIEEEATCSHEERTPVLA